MAANVSVIGRTTRVHGRVTGAVDLQVQGFVEGEIVVSGDVTVEVHAMVGAGVRGRRLVVRGAVKGDLVGEEAVLLEEGARVVGDVRAPRVAIGPGALVRGFVETGEGNGAPARAVRATQGATRSQTVARSVPAAAETKGARPATGKAPVAPPTVVASAKPAVKQAGTINESNGPAARNVPRRPPPPVVPALKKAKGQIAKRKER
jgi:cytoskeletal protein CcmA (bactofilin family)